MLIVFILIVLFVVIVTPVLSIYIQYSHFNQHHFCGHVREMITSSAHFLVLLKIQLLKGVQGKGTKGALQLIV